MKNPYKRNDVFACNYETHERFANRVSVYHVLKEKKCYPHGCLMFKWECQLVNKGKKCVRGFKHVGRLCAGCTFYADEKIHYQPRILLSDLEYRRFQAEVEAFDDWIEKVSNRDIDFWCRVSSIKPCFKKQVWGSKGQIRLEGYIVVVQEGFIGTERFDDMFYLSISPAQQERHRIATGDTFEARGRLKLDRGRLLFNKVWGMDFEQRSHQKTWNNSEALVAKQVATQFSTQPETCLRCPKGALVDVTEKHQGQVKTRRELYCLEGIQNPQECYVYPLEKIDMCTVKS